MAMKTNLIMVEGLPGTGKSTTASMIAEILRKKGKKAVCVDEGESPHPADYDNYDFPDFPAEREKILEKWKEFVLGASQDTIYVFNCIFLQNPMCECMMRFGMDLEECRNYIREIENIIKPLNPQVIYLDEPSVKSVIDRVKEERGDEWLQAVIGYHVEQEYGKKNHLSGYDGYISCLEERKRRELEILKTSSLDCYVVSQDMSVDEFAFLHQSVGWDLPTKEQMEAAIRHSTKSYIVRHKGKPIATSNWLGDFGMHWFMKEFIVAKEYQGQMLGTLLYRFAENYIKSTMQDDWKVCIDLRAAKGKEPFYESLGFQIMSESETGSGMEMMVAVK